jgi:hypothetical protein
MLFFLSSKRRDSKKETVRKRSICAEEINEKKWLTDIIYPK